MPELPELSYLQLIFPIGKSAPDFEGAQGPPALLGYRIMKAGVICRRL